MTSDFELPEGGVEIPDPPWEPWRPGDVAERMRGVDFPWYVAAGWALDLFRGYESRLHEDLEIAVPWANFGAVRELFADHEIDVVGAGRRWPLDSAAFAVTHQTWIRDRLTGVYRLDIFRERHDGDVWICRRDDRIRLPYREIIRRSAEGVPYLRPELVFLFKARLARPKDDSDLDGVLPLLSATERSWLSNLIRQVHPNHRWLERI